MFSYHILDSPSHHYDHFVANHEHGHLFQSFRWGELKRISGWTPLRLIIKDNNTIIAATSILKRRWVGQDYILYSPRGPALDFSKDELIDGLLVKIHQLSKIEQATFWKIDPNIPKNSRIIHAKLIASNFRKVEGTAKTPTLQLDEVWRIPLPYSDISHYNLIKKTTQKQSLIVKETSSQADFKVFYAMLLEHSRVYNVLIRTYAYFRQLWDIFHGHGGHLFLILNANEVIGGSFIINYGNVCYNVYSVIREDHRVDFADSLLHLTIMDWAAEHGLTEYEIMDTILASKKTGKPTRPFTGERFLYLGEYDLVFSPAKYQLWRVVKPILRWSVSS